MEGEVRIVPFLFSFVSGSRGQTYNHLHLGTRNTEEGSQKRSIQFSDFPPLWNILERSREWGVVYEKASEPRWPLLFFFF